MIRNISSYWRSDSKSLVNAAEIVVHEINRDSGIVIVYFLRETIREARESTHPHSH